MTSGGMDPAALLGLHGVDPGDAFPTLVREFTTRGGANQEPAHGPLTSFPTMAAYERAHF